MKKYCLFIFLFLLMLPQIALATFPVARDFSAKVIKDTQHSTLNSLRLQASDPDAGDLLTYTILSLPSHGTLQEEASEEKITSVLHTVSSNKLRYIPDPGFQGQDSFTYQALDTSSSSNSATVSLNVVEWFPPIGIPEPEFGIKETYRMYDDPAKRNPALTYTQNAEGGFYTHYIDNTHPNATNSNNPNGTADTPRLSLPYPIPAGSVVEVHGGPYNGTWTNLYGEGSKTYPIFVRGPSLTDKPVYHYTSGGIRTGGSYLIIENLTLDTTGMSTHSTLIARDHLVFRNIEGYGKNAGLGARGIDAATPVAHIVYYNNYFHEVGDVYGDTDNGSGLATLKANSYTNNLWIVDNLVTGSGQDSFQIGHGGVEIQYIYVGRNEFNHDKENAVDVKTARDLIFSQNRVHGYRGSNSSGGDIVRINDEGYQDNIWILFNEIYDGALGINVTSAVFAPYIIGNVIYDCDNKGIYGNHGYGRISSTVLHNTVANCGTGVYDVKECKNNVVSYCTTGIVVDSGEQAANNVLDIPLTNIPTHSIRTSYWVYTTNAATLNDGNTTSATLSGMDFEAMGLEANDRVSVILVPECTWTTDVCRNGLYSGGSSTWPSPAFQRVQSVDGDTFAFKRDFLCPDVASVNNVTLTIYYYPDLNHNEFYLDAGWDVEVGDHLEYDYDGVVRVVMAVYRNDAIDPAGTPKDKVVFDPPVASGIQCDKVVSNWGSRTNFARDFSLPEFSLAIDAGMDHPAYQSFYDLYGIVIRKDAAGDPRPQGFAWDIGAYEYVPESGSLLYGDVSGDGEIGAYDAALTAQAAVGSITLTAEQVQKADVSGEGEVGAYDAALIAQYSVGLINRFPVEG